MDASSSVSPAELFTLKMLDLWSQTPSSKPCGALSAFVVPSRKSGVTMVPTNFTGGEREIRDAIQDLDHDIIERSLHEKDVEWHCQPLTKWHFHPPTASHMSGVWERLIRSVRGTMKAILGHPHAFVTRETLRIVFAETVGILNSPSSDDPNDWEPITPSHLLQQRQGMSLPPGDFQDGDLYSRKQWRRGQILSNHFWARWLREYLPLLQERKKWVLKRRNLAVNDLVLVVTENAPRGHWLLGRVTRNGYSKI